MVGIAAVVILHLYVRKPARPSSMPEEKEHDGVFFEKIHGVTFNNDDGSSRQRVISRCKVGEELEIIPEPTNRFDRGAMKVCRKNGEQLGYWHAGGRMPASLAPNSEDPQGACWRVTIKSIYRVRSELRLLGVNVRVEITR
jgi:hypothetical protein